MGRITKTRAALMALAASVFGGSVAAAQVRERVIHDFVKRAGGKEAGPSGLVAIGGDLFGTTHNGGDAHCQCGVVYKVDQATGKETVLHTFTGGTDGAAPGPLAEMDGVLYGWTEAGGNSGCDIGCGTIYSITPDGQYRQLYQIPGSFGFYIPGALLPANGVLYGASPNFVYAITPDGQFTTLFTFSGGADGAIPNGDLILYNNTLYGTTSDGGAYGQGVVYSLTLDGTETVLHSFGAQGDGIQPGGGLVNWNGVFYGTTSGGTSQCNCIGVIYSITPDGQYKVVHPFPPSGKKDGVNPFTTPIVLNDTLYGVTGGGGTSRRGVVFSLQSSGREQIVYSFAGAPNDGSDPTGKLLAIGNTLYGGTVAGGAKGGGVVFSITP